MQPTENQPAAQGESEPKAPRFQPPRLVALGRVNDLTQAVVNPGGTDFFSTSG